MTGRKYKRRKWHPCLHSKFQITIKKYLYVPAYTEKNKKINSMFTFRIIIFPNGILVNHNCKWDACLSKKYWKLNDVYRYRLRILIKTQSNRDEFSNTRNAMDKRWFLKKIRRTLSQCIPIIDFTYAMQCIILSFDRMTLYKHH